MDAFFASVEMRDNPRLRNRPLIIGGAPESRGVVATASYEARRFGVHSAMSARRAQELCPHGIFMRPNMEKYKTESAAILEILRRYTPLVEPVSIDEAYLDVTVNNFGDPSATRIAADIRRAILKERGLTASAGVSFNKFLAKMASERRKPDGLSVITPQGAPKFLETLPIDKFHGIGKVTAAKFMKIGVRTGKELLALDKTILTANFGKVGFFYYNIVRGIDERPVEPVWERKSVGRETTFETDTKDAETLASVLRSLSTMVSARLRRAALAGRTVTLKVRYCDFQTMTRAASFPAPTDVPEQIAAAAEALLAGLSADPRPIRLLGVTVSNFKSPDVPPNDAPPEPTAIQLEFDFSGLLAAEAHSS